MRPQVRIEHGQIRGRGHGDSGGRRGGDEPAHDIVPDEEALGVNKGHVHVADESPPPVRERHQGVCEQRGLVVDALKPGGPANPALDDVVRYDN